MKLKILVFLVLFSVTLFGQFRGVDWGSSVDEVMAKLKADNITVTEADETGALTNILYHESTIAGLEAYVIFQFIDVGLVSGRISFLEDHSNKNLYINDYNDIKDALTTKYDKPDEDETLWYDDLFKDDYEDWGTAISRGDMSKQSIWLKPSTKILHQLSGDNYEITHVLFYQSIAHRDAYEKHLKKKQSSEL